MDVEAEEEFKICGLCSQYVDESVLIKADLKTFLLDFLALGSDSKKSSNLPEKTCLECYQSAIECKRFRDACLKSINKLQKNNKIASSMVLGKASKTTGKKSCKKASAAEAMNTLKAEAGVSKKKKILESLGLDPDQIDIDVSSSPPAPGPARRSRSAAAKETVSSTQSTKRGRQNSKSNFECRVLIKKVERDRADRAFELGDMTPVATVSRAAKRKLTPQSKPASAPPSAKKARGRPAAEKAVTPVSSSRARRGTTPAPETPKEDTRVSRSSFGRVRNSATKSGYVYGKDLNISPEIEVTPAAPVTPAKSKASPKKAPKAVVEPPEEDEDEDMEEVFPTIGPYQCEICQVITDTKAEFVAHIKGKHRDVVDEEVLRSLESDLRKSKKKKEREGISEAVAPSPSPAAAAKKTPKAKKAKPASKKVTPKAKPKAKPASKKESWMCDICDQVLNKSTKTEILKHKASAACQAARKEREEKESKDADDPLGNLDKEEDETPDMDKVMEDIGDMVKEASPYKTEAKVETKIITGDPFDAMLNNGKVVEESPPPASTITNGFFNVDGHNDDAHETAPVVVESVSDFANIAFGFP